MRRTVAASVLAVIAVGLVGASAAPAAQPTFTRIDIDDSGTDEFFTQECGFDVTFAEQGHITIREFAPGVKGLANMLSINVGVTLSANGNEFRFRDVGADQARITPDGTVVVSIMGQVPFEFTGVLKFDPDTGETIHEPQHALEEEVAEVCAALTA